MKNVATSVNFGAEALLAQLHDLTKEIEGVRRAEDPEYVHRMRVASRRLRTRLAIFAGCLQDKKAEHYSRMIRKLTKALGEARDTDVQMIFVQDFLAHVQDKRHRPGIKRLLLRLSQYRRKLQKQVLRVLDDTEKSSVLPEMQKTFYALLSAGTPDEGSPSPYELARIEIFARLTEVLDFESSVRDPGNITELHRMRIAAKHLRYSMETFAPLYPDKLKKPIKITKAVQEMLGDIHDCDVWTSYLPQFLDEERLRTQKYYGHIRGIARLKSGLEQLAQERHNNRDKRYGEFITFWDKHKPVWNELHQTLNAMSGAYSHNTPQSPDYDTCVRTAVEIGRAHGFEENHARQVTNLALAIFDCMHELHGLGTDERSLLACAGLLHDIGLAQSLRGHHKHSMEKILASDLFPLSPREQMMTALIAYYHRKVIPSARHEQYAALPQEDRLIVSTLAAILRVA
ncbi:MAG TPA: CHAD domain-containing protein, partial [Desulfomonilia bacterium]|nr:CHAD domain-containing protein [Desulfomonilia bacterium]